jgi:hypothetical protein
MALSSSNEFDDRFYTVIGQIVVTFNSIEALLRECVAESLGPDTNLNVVVLSRINFSELLEIFRITSLVSFQPRPDSEELQKRALDVATDLKAVNERRNIVVHSHYWDSVEINIDDNDDLYGRRVLGRTKIKRNLDHVLFPSEASEEIGDLSDLESDLERLKKSYSDLARLSRHLITPASLGSIAVEQRIE